MFPENQSAKIGLFSKIPKGKGLIYHFKLGKNRLDIEVGYTSTFILMTKKNEVVRLIKLGATRYPWRYQPDDDFIVLEDPDGNLFCVVQIVEK